MVDHAIRECPCGKDRHRFSLFVIEGVQHAPHFVMRTGQLFADRFARGQQFLLEMHEARLLRDERV